MSGFVAIHRSAFDHPLLKDGERFRAWFWMVARAVWKPTRFDIHGKIITLDRGQFSSSVREMAEAWGWSKSAVDRFLTRLKTETMIGTDSGTGRLIITIRNYEKYQSTEDKAGTASGTAGGTAAGQQRDIKEEGNKGTIEEEPSGSSPPTPIGHLRGKDWPAIPDWVPIEEWNAFIVMRRRKSANPTPRAVELMLKTLTELRDAGHKPGAVLDQSTVKNWTDLYHLKDDRNGNAPRDTRDPFLKAIDRELGIAGNGSAAGSPG